MIFANKPVGIVVKDVQPPNVYINILSSPDTDDAFGKNRFDGIPADVKDVQFRNVLLNKLGAPDVTLANKPVGIDVKDVQPSNVL